MKKKSVALAVILLITMLFVQSCTTIKYCKVDVKMKKIERSAQYKDGDFLNYKAPPEMEFDFGTMWDWLFADNDTKPDVELPTQKIDFKKITNAKSNELKVTWVGHSSQIVNIDGKIVLTDPMYEKSTVTPGPSRFIKLPLTFDEIPEIDLVIISHNHYDHLNVGTLEAIHPRVKQFIVPLMVGAQLEKIGIPREKIKEMDWWDEVKPFEGFMVAFTPAQHFSGRGLFDRNESLWGSFVIEGPYHKIYFSGDGGYSNQFKEIGEKYGPFDYTFMECGQYNELWHYAHMFPEESVQAHIDLKGKIMQPMHWGTFSLALHAWYDPMIRAAKAADSLGVKISTPIVGETITIDDNLTTERWWENMLQQKELYASEKRGK